MNSVGWVGGFRFARRGGRFVVFLWGFLRFFLSIGFFMVGVQILTKACEASSFEVYSWRK